MNGQELPEDWKIPKAWADWALQERQGWTLAHVKKSAKKFHEYHRLQHSTRENVDQWELAFRNWIRKERATEPENKSYQGSGCAIAGCSGLGSLAHQGGGPFYCRDHF